MRIISGTHKGRRIDAPKKLGIRPTTDFAKVSLFNILTNHFDFTALSVLDLFSGSGAIAFEFASRGSKAIVSVEKDFSRANFIKSKSSEFGFSCIKVVQADVFRFLGSHSGAYDIIFADPPYGFRGVEKIPGLVFEKNFLKQEGWLILEHAHDTDFTGREQFLEKRAYGAVNFSIFKSKQRP